MFVAGGISTMAHSMSHEVSHEVSQEPFGRPSTQVSYGPNSSSHTHRVFPSSRNGELSFKISELPVHPSNLNHKQIFGSPSYLEQDPISSKPIVIGLVSKWVVANDTRGFRLKLPLVKGRLERTF